MIRYCPKCDEHYTGRLTCPDCGLIDGLTFEEYEAKYYGIYEQNNTEAR